MSPAPARALLTAIRRPLEAPQPVAGAAIQQTLKPGRRAQQWLWLQWVAAQLSALAGVALVVTAFDYTVFLPRWLQWVDVFTQWGDVATYVPEAWRWAVPILAVSGFALQLPFSFLSVWLTWRTTWYVVTDQGVQLHHGLWTTHEDSMRFGNIQQVMLQQGPVQRVLGLADVVLSTAGQRVKNDDDDEDGKRKQRGRFRDLELGQAQRLLGSIRAQLPGAAESSVRVEVSPGAVEAARVLLEEARALRGVIEQGK